MLTDKNKKILKSLERQTKTLFARGNASEKDKKVVGKWMEKFAEMCREERADASD